MSELKKLCSFVIPVLLTLAILSGCGGGDTGKGSDSSAPNVSAGSLGDNTSRQDSSQAAVSQQPTGSESVAAGNVSGQTSGGDSDRQEPSKTSSLWEPGEVGSAFDLSNVPEYSGEAYVVMNGGNPYFDTSALSMVSSEYYAPLDSLGRCGVAYACVGQDIMPTEERGSIGMVKPSGWHTVKYDSVDGKYLYNRCHLIGYQLSAENANTSNLITGTRYLNIQGMLPFENMVADYVKETENHVAYRVTPIFSGDELVARGVLLEGWSVEDDGDGVGFCSYAYNVQPGIEIDYATGDSKLIETSEPGDKSVEQKPAANPSEPEPETNNSEPQGTTYMLNTNTKKFHYPSCSSVKQMKESNKKEYTGSRDDVIGMGYDPCKRCNP